MTIVGYTLFGNMSAVGYPANQTNITVCAGQTINFTAFGKYGVPPYHYLWTKDGGNTYDTTYTGAYSLSSQLTRMDTVLRVMYWIHAVIDSKYYCIYNINVLNAPAHQCRAR